MLRVDTQGSLPLSSRLMRRTGGRRWQIWRQSLPQPHLRIVCPRLGQALQHLTSLLRQALTQRKQLHLARQQLSVHEQLQLLQAILRLAASQQRVISIAAWQLVGALLLQRELLLLRPPLKARSLPRQPTT